MLILLEDVQKEGDEANLTWLGRKLKKFSRLYDRRNMERYLMLSAMYTTTHVETHKVIQSKAHYYYLY